MTTACDTFLDTTKTISLILKTLDEAEELQLDSGVDRLAWAEYQASLAFLLLAQGALDKAAILQTRAIATDPRSHGHAAFARS